MKIQYLTVIFILIMMPIIIVFSLYIDNEVKAVKTEISYNSRLLNSTYDAIKAFQMSTVHNNASEINTIKIDILEASVKTFFNSLSTNFGYSGYNSKVMNEYVPAVVFTMFDGYYLYSPYYNTLTGVDKENVDDSYGDGKLLHGLKPYVYYSCRYTPNRTGMVVR